MKKKFLIFTLCFTLIFSSLSYKRSYADSGIISLPMLATVSSLAVGSNIIINNNDDLYDLGRLFYDYIENYSTLTWQTVSAVFAASSTLIGDKVSVDSKFLDIVKEFFDYRFLNDFNISYIGLIPVIPSSAFEHHRDYMFRPPTSLGFDEPFPLGFQFKHSDGIFYDSYILLTSSDSSKYMQVGYYYNDSFVSKFTHKYSDIDSVGLVCANSVYGTFNVFYDSTFQQYSLGYGSVFSSNTYSFPYDGGYTWDNVDSRKENDSVVLPIPGNLGQLVGQGSTDFWDNTNDLVGSGDLSIPNVDNPSISLDDTISFPSVGNPSIPDVDNPSVPNEGIWSTIKDFIVDLVVPSDTFWTDTWGGLYNNFTSSFPMVDMDGFNDLVTGEKKFPNIDIDIMGVRGRVVNGDVINSIVDWLRPIIAGFMMLCLMFFNYRKIYKLIRNSEPLPGIASSGTADFKTGISEYNWRDSYVDIHADYQAYKEARK